MCVLHKCDNPPCIRPDHLFLGTLNDNNQDMLKKGRYARGDNAPARLHPESVPRGKEHWTQRTPEKIGRGARKNSVLTDKKVIEMRKLREKWWTHHLLANKYKVSISMITMILQGKRWSHLPVGENKSLVGVNQWTGKVIKKI